MLRTKLSNNTFVQRKRSVDKLTLRTCLATSLVGIAAALGVFSLSHAQALANVYFQLSTRADHEKPLQISPGLTNPNAVESLCSDYYRAEIQPATASTLNATMTLFTSDPELKGPFTQPWTVPMSFFPDGTVRADFPALDKIGPRPTPLGNDTITVTFKPSQPGVFDKSTGALSLPISLHISHSLWLLTASDIDFVLTTATATSPRRVFALIGSALARDTGALTLVAASQFRGGILAGIEAAITVEGHLSPVP